MSEETPLSRRDLLRGRLLRPLADRVRDAATRSLAPLTGLSEGVEDSPRDHATHSERYRKSFPILRPPGAIEEEAFLQGCTRCNACVEACPHQAIVHAPERFRRAAGTPMIDPINSPCMMCPDMPCIQACEPRVLRSEVPVKMGIASIDVTNCLAHQRSFCTVCYERCPVHGAIEVIGGKPSIVADRCTGCGVCQHVCPAPQNAILLLPEQNRPTVQAPPNESNELRHG